MNDAALVAGDRVPARGLIAMPLALGLVIAADLLLYGRAPGINIALLGALSLLAMVLRNLSRLPPKGLAIGLAAGFVTLLPLIEAPSLAGVAVAAVGLGFAALCFSGLAPKEPDHIPEALLRYAVVAPVLLAADTGQVAKAGALNRVVRNLSRGILVWLVPVGFAIVFLWLFASANPLIEQVLRAITPQPGVLVFEPLRYIFWVFAAIVAWPLLQPRLMPGLAVASPAMQGPPKPAGLLFGEAAILRSLILFNLLFAVQSLLDLTYLWGGLGLPDGMTYADYAHRGAFPLIATALLAAVFVLAAMRRGGPGEGNARIRALIYLWIGQNVLLCVSSILRLELYVGVYALTPIRLAALVWMGLVAVGLVLIMLRILWRRTNRWLVATNLLALTLTVYGWSAFDVDAFIARFNVEQSREFGGEAEPLHSSYLTSLGPSAIPAIDAYLAQPEGSGYDRDKMRNERNRMALDVLGQSADWRSWTWRHQRLVDYLLANPTAPRE